MSFRKSTPRGQMSKGANSQPAIMMMPPHIRATFMPNPPLRHYKPRPKSRKNNWTGMTSLLKHFETNPPPKREQSKTTKVLKKEKIQQRKDDHEKELAPKIEAYRQEQKESNGQFEGINCYNCLFIGRLAYEVTERKLLREMESFGAVKDLKLIFNRPDATTTTTPKSRGYAFCEFEHEEDMKRAYRAADGHRLEGRQIVVDVERGHTVPNWLPRRLGGGLGGTRIGGKEQNVKAPGRFDPSKPPMMPPPPAMGMSMGRGGGMPPPPFGARGGPGPPPQQQYGAPRGRGGGFGNSGGGNYAPPRGGGQWERGPPPERGGGGWSRDKRQRSRSPDHHRGGPRRRY